MRDQLISAVEKAMPSFQNCAIAVKFDSTTLLFSSRHNLEGFVHDQYMIGDLSLQMTAYIFMKVLKTTYPDQELSSVLSQKLVDLFPESRVLSNIQSRLLIEKSSMDLLSHKSGLSDYMGDAFDGEYTPPPYSYLEAFPEMIEYVSSAIANAATIQKLTKPVATDELLSCVSYDPLKNLEPAYTNYYIIAKLIEELSGKSFYDVFDSIVSVPADMQDTYAPGDGNYHMVRNLPQLASLQPDQNKKIFMDLINFVGVSNVVSTTSDLLKWNDFLYNKGDKDILDIMLADYGKDEDGVVMHIGLVGGECKFGDSVGSYGEIDSYNSFLVRLDNSIDIAFLSNNENDANLIADVLAQFEIEH